MNNDSIDALVAAAADAAEASAPQAPSRWKSRIYSQMVREAAADAPLLSLPESKAAGRGLCVFEELVRIAPAGAKCANYCRVCHARVLAERIENAPIYWPHCPYVSFQNR